MSNELVTGSGSFIVLIPICCTLLSETTTLPDAYEPAVYVVVIMAPAATTPDVELAP